MLNGIKLEIEIIFANIDILFDSIDENEFNSIKGGFIVCKHFYHLVHSLDKFTINPIKFIEPNFHNENMHITNLNIDTLMEKTEIFNYYNNVKNKIRTYINSLVENDLDEKYIGKEGNSGSKGDLILAAIRHTYYHVGYLHCCIKIEKDIIKKLRINKRIIVYARTSPNRIVNALLPVRRLGLRSAMSVATLAPTPHCATVCQPWSCSASSYSG